MAGGRHTLMWVAEARGMAAFVASRDYEIRPGLCSLVWMEKMALCLRMM